MSVENMPETVKPTAEELLAENLKLHDMIALSEQDKNDLLRAIQIMQDENDKLREKLGKLAEINNDLYWHLMQAQRHIRRAEAKEPRIKS